MLKVLLILLPMIFLSGCKFPTIEPIERCIVGYKPEANIVKCRCHMYEISDKKIGRISESTDKPLEYCHGAVAFEGETSWSKIYAWLTEVFSWLEDRKNNAEESSSLIHPHD